MRRLLFSVVTVATVLMSIEGVVRLGWTEPAPVLEGRLEGDLTQRWTLTPGRPAMFGGVVIPINSRGYRGHEIASPRPPCSFRIYAAGDSSTFGHGVPMGQAFVELLPKMLKGALPPQLTVEAVNGAVPGYSTYQSMSRLTRDGWGLTPDMLIIANAWSDAAITESPDRRYLPQQARQRIAQRRAGGFRGIVSELATYRLLRHLLAPRRVVAVLGLSKKEGQHRVPPAEFEHNLTLMVTRSRRHGTEPLLLMMPHPFDQRLTTGKRKQDRDEYTAPGVPEMGHGHRQVMRELARRHGVPLLDGPRLVASEARDLFADMLHPNAAGHALLARQLKQMIVANPRFLARALSRCQRRRSRE